MKKIPLALLVVLSLSRYLAAQSYTVTDLGTLPGGNSFGYGINNAGQVTGNSTTSSATHAFLYSNGSMSDLGTLGGTNSTGYGINDSGQVTGFSTISAGASHAFLYSNGSMSDLGTLGGNSFGYGINNAGQVTGYSSTGSANHAFLYSTGSPLTDLGTLGGTTSFGYGINNTGQVAGYSNNSGNFSHAFLYSNGSMTDLGTLLGGSTSFGYGINNAGQVTGSATTSSGANRAFLYSSGSMTNLGTLGGSFSYGYGINNAGQVTGRSSISGGAFHAFLYSNGSMSDLNSLVSASSGVTNINESSNGNHINDWGQIAAQGTVGGVSHAVLLSPINPLEATTGQSRDAKVVSGVSFSKLSLQTGSGGFGTTVSLLDGTASANRDVVTAIDGSAHSGIASDVISLTGTGTDTFVLQLSYNKVSAIASFGSESSVRLGWYDPSDSTWKNAVAGNTGGTPTFAGDRAYNSATDFTLGTYGVDTTNNTAWAVINHNSQFGTVPEPSTYGLIAGAGIVLFFLRRRKVS